MTKRFNVTANEENWLEITDDEVNLNQLQVCDLLNEQHETIQQLKSELNEIKQLKCILCGLELGCTIRNELK